MMTGGVFPEVTKTFFDMLASLNIDKSGINFISTKIICIFIRTSYYIFCMRNKVWSTPELMVFYIATFLFFFTFL